MSPVAPPIATTVDVELRMVEDLRPYANNARTHPPEQVAQLVASIRRFGYTNPVLADDEDNLHAGHGRLLAVKQIYAAGEAIRLPGGRELPPGTIPVVDCTGWPEADRRAYIIADNRLAETSAWDEDLLKIELSFLREQSFDMPVIGFDAKTLARLIDFSGNKGVGDPDAAPPKPENPVSRRGDVWVLGHHRIICGDCTAAPVVEDVLNGDVPHLMVTDPPYGVEYDPSWRTKAGVGSKGAATGKVLNDDRADWREAWALFPGSVAYVWHGGLHAGVVEQSLKAAGFGVRAQIVWVKTRPALSRGHYHWQHEPAFYSVREGEEPADDSWQRFVPEHETAGYAVRDGATASWSGDRKQSTVWFIEHIKSDTGHGTQKPVECMLRPMENNSAPGDLVYEPFSGSGTTIIAGEMSGRRVRAIELNPAYVDVAVRRWQTFTGKTAVLHLDGRSFVDIAKERGLV
jgi:DNA modification methylase